MQHHGAELSRRVCVVWFVVGPGLADTRVSKEFALKGEKKRGREGVGGD